MRRKYFLSGSYVNLCHVGGSHLGISVCTKNTNIQETFPDNIAYKWFSCFTEEEFYNILNLMLNVASHYEFLFNKLNKNLVKHNLMTKKKKQDQIMVGIRLAWRTFCIGLSNLKLSNLLNLVFFIHRFMSSWILWCKKGSTNLKLFLNFSAFHWHVSKSRKVKKYHLTVKNIVSLPLVENPIK